MKCEEAQVRVSAYLDGEMDGAERKEMDGHLEGCASCRMLLGELKAQEERLRELAGMPLPESGPEGAVLRWRAEAKAPAVRGPLVRFRRYLAVPLAAAAAAAIVFSLRPGDDFEYRPLDPEQLQALQSTLPETRLKYRIAVVLTDLHNMPETDSLAQLKEKIVREDFLGSIAAAKAEALRNGDRESLRLFTQLEMVLLSIINEEPSSRRMARTIRL